MADSEKVPQGMITIRPAAYLKLYRQTVGGQSTKLCMHRALRWVARVSRAFPTAILRPINATTLYQVILQTPAIGGPITAIFMA